MTSVIDVKFISRCLYVAKVVNLLKIYFLLITHPEQKLK